MFSTAVRAIILITSSTSLVSWYLTTYHVPRPAPFNPHLGAAVTFAFGEGLKDPITPLDSKLAGVLNHTTPSSLEYSDIPLPMPTRDLFSVPKILHLACGADWIVCAATPSIRGVLQWKALARCCGLPRSCPARAWINSWRHPRASGPCAPGTISEAPNSDRCSRNDHLNR